MSERERGFTLVEMVVAMAILAVLLAAGGVWMLSMHPAALTHATDDYDAVLASARSTAETSGNGATLVFAPRAGGVPGFTLRAYSGRPVSAGAVVATNAMPLVSDATVSEATLGKPPFAIFIGASGHASGKAQYPAVDANGNATFAAIATEPACPAGGFVLTFTGGQGATATRTLPCTPTASTAPGGPGLPNPSPTPNVPLVWPSLLVYHWPAAPEQAFVATEWGYTHWFASSSGFECGTGVATYPNVLPSPYSPPYTAAEGEASPAPRADEPYSYPNSNGASMNDAPATFRLDPSAAGLCTPAVRDDYNQVAQGSAQVMGWLTATYDGKAYTHLTTPVLTLPSSVFGKKGAAVTLPVSKTYDSEALQPAVALDSACASYVTVATAAGTTPAKPSTKSATASVTLTLATMPSSKVDCGGTIYDQYAGSQNGEGVPFNTTLLPAADLDTEPGGLVYPIPGTRFQSGDNVVLPDGSTLTNFAGCPHVNEPIAFPWLVQSDGTVNWSTPLTSAPAGSGLTINANGCDSGSGGYSTDTGAGDPSQGQTFPNPIAASEPSQTAGTLNYTNNCGSSISTPYWVGTTSALPGPHYIEAFSESQIRSCAIQIYDQGTGNSQQEQAVTLGVQGPCNQVTSQVIVPIGASCTIGDFGPESGGQTLCPDGNGATVLDPGFVGAFAVSPSSDFPGEANFVIPAYETSNSVGEITTIPLSNGYVRIQFHRLSVGNVQVFVYKETLTNTGLQTGNNGACEPHATVTVSAASTMN